MGISKYNLIRFILDESYSDCENTCYTGDDFCDREVFEAQWKNWFHKVSRIYNHKIPIQLLEGLRRKQNEALNGIIEEYVKSQKEKRDLFPIVSKEKAYEKWVNKISISSKN